MPIKSIRIYRLYLIAFLIFLVFISTFYINQTEAYLTQTNELVFDSQIGRMDVEIKLNGNLPTGTWHDIPVAVKLMGGTKISSDEQFNMAVTPVTIDFKNIDQIPLNLTYTITMPEITDNGVLYIILPYGEELPIDKDYKSFILQETSLQASALYATFKQALNSYNQTALDTYKSTFQNDKFTADSKVVRLNEGEKDTINAIFWGEYDQLNVNYDFASPEDSEYQHLDINFSIKASARQIQDPVFSLIQ